jgi:hypothetical protein
MTAVERYFFTPLYYARSPWSVVRWWEARRPLFNLAVGTAGVVSLAAFMFFAGLPPHASRPWIPWMPILVYAGLANLCYTLGPIADLALRRLLGERAPAVGPVLFRYGFVFSVGVTLLPIGIGAFIWVVRTVATVAGW